MRTLQKVSAKKSEATGYTTNAMPNLHLNKTINILKQGTVIVLKLKPTNKDNTINIYK